MYIGIVSPVSGRKLKEARTDARSGNPSRAFFSPCQSRNNPSVYFLSGNYGAGFVVGSTRRIFIAVPRFDVNTSIALGPTLVSPYSAWGRFFVGA